MTAVEPPTAPWGDPLDDPVCAARLLRAHAARSGVTLQPTGPDTALAATIAAAAWCVALGTTTFTSPARHGRPALAALAAICLRAAGQPTVGHDIPPGSVDDAWWAHVERWATWADTTGVGRHVLALAASDVAAGADDARLAGIAAVLAAAADA